MMASILILDTKAIQHYKVYDDYAVHRVVYDLFPATARKFLYYRYPKPEESGIKVLIISEDQPLVPQYGSIESKLIQTSFLEYQKYAFKVRLNPVVREQDKAHSIRGYEELASWFSLKQKQWGFSADPMRLELSSIGVVQIKGKQGPMTFNECTFSGVLEVVDRSRFIKSFHDGLGRGKGFGFGLLQVQPLH